MSTAFIFPGQGSQTLGMLSHLAESFAFVKKTFDEGSEVLNIDLWDLCQNGPVEELNKTENTQPVLLAAGVACWRIWRSENGPMPLFLAGHSLGEYTALVCAGSIDYSTGIKLVHDRGSLMQSAVSEGEGAMAAVMGLDDNKVISICNNLSHNELSVSAANFNAPGQVVIAGHAEVIHKAIDVLKEEGARRAIILPVSVPSHCNLMLPAAKKLADHLNNISITKAEIPVIQNVDVKTRTNPEEIIQALIKQLYSPVRWYEIINKLKDNGVNKIIECGPGKVLTGLTKRIDKDIDALVINDIESLESALAV